MKSTQNRMMAALGARWVALRRARNLRRSETRTPRLWPVALGLAMAGGAAVIIAHARQMNALQAGALDAAVFQPLLPGAVIEVPEGSGAWTRALGDAALVVVGGMQGQTPVRIPLCGRAQADGRLAPLLIGYPFDEVERLAGRHGALAPGLRVALGPAGGMPRLKLTGKADGTPLAVQVGGATDAHWSSDAGPAAFGHDGWLTWLGGALRIQRVASATCPAGEVTAQLFQPGGPARALVTAYGAKATASAWLRPGRHPVPAAPTARLEDEELFGALQRRGLIRLGASNLIEVAPRDLAAWRATPTGQRTATLDSWNAVVLDAPARRLIERLYRAADGEYLRAQVAIFNTERKLLAWRLRPGAGGVATQALAGAGLPASAARLFAEVPQGWAEWSHVSRWQGADSVTLTLAPAPGARE
ncbi:MAG: hypothetical protein ACLGI6_19880, partial [Gammaproteobacteria bacterium]